MKFMCGRYRVRPGRTIWRADARFIHPAICGCDIFAFQASDADRVIQRMALWLSPYTTSLLPLEV